MWSKIKALFKLQLSEDREQNRAARNLTALLLIVILGTFIPTVIRVATTRQIDNLVITFTFLFVVSVGFLWLVRNGKLLIPSYAIPVLFLMAFTFLTSGDQGLHDIGMPGFVLIILLGGLLLGKRGVLIFTGLTMLSVIGIGISEMTGVLNSELSSVTTVADTVLVALEFGFVGFILYLVLNNLLDTVNIAQQANAELQSLSQSLEAKVKDRVRDLTLATEAGSQIAQVRDLDTVLQDAVTLVRDLFDLYYVQVYLIDENGKRLVIQSGTGIVGTRLTKQQHSLPISRSSLNGQAVVEKRVVFVEDTAVNPNFFPNPLLPETRSEMAVPLMIGDDVLGVLNLQDNKIGILNEEGLPAFQTVANQLAIAIQNANLFKELTIAQQEVEEAARRLTRENWQNYMDGIHEPQQIGMQYAQNEIRPLAANVLQSDKENVLNVPVLIANEPLGVIAVEGKEAQAFDDKTVEMITAVSQQVSRQIENLRLLGEAERYRTEAEKVTKRLVREAWKTFRADAVSEGFVYDQKQVEPIQTENEEALDAEAKAEISAPLDIQGEMIGQLFLEGVSAEDESAFYLVGVIADHLSTHIENLRLAQQTEVALAMSQRQREELAVINEIANSVAAQTDTKTLIESVLDQLKRVLPTDSFTVALYDNAFDRLNYLFVYDAVNGIQYDLPPSGLRKTDISYGVIHNKKAEMVLFTADEMEALRQNRPDNLIGENASLTGSLLFAPMMRGDQVMGVVSVQSYELNAYTRNNLELVTGVASYVATGIQNAQLFDEIQSQSEKERVINVISQKIQGTLDIETALQTAVSELGNALKARYTQVKIAATENTAVFAKVNQPNQPMQLKQNGTHS